jgi:methylglutaconyl-CoA hydratase
MEDPVVTSVAIDDATTILTLNRPEKRNSLTIALMQSLCNEIARLEQDPDCRIIVICSAGPVFCAGLDLKEASDAAIALESAKWVAKTFEAISCSSLISIAAVQGAAVAGGAGLMASCDFVVASDELTISFPEARRGLVPALVATKLRDRLRDSELRELFLLAEPIDAQRALRLGLVQRVVPSDRIMDEALELAALVRKSAPEAIRQTKRLLWEIRHRTSSEAADLAMQFHTDARTSREADEGLAAFLEKRGPNWK